MKPVVGLEVSINNYKILLYIKNYQGYLNLIKICTRVNDNSITIDDIIKYKDNLFFLIPFSSLNFYLEYKDKITDIYLGFSNKKEESDALVITKDVVYLKPCLYKNKEDSDYLKYLYLIRDGKTLNDNVTYDILDKAIEDSDVINAYSNIGLLNTLKIVDACNLEFPKASLLLPIYECPKGVDSSIYLISLAKAGLTKRLNNNITKDYLDRLSYELDIIKNMGFSNYFLVVYDFIRYAKKKGILVGPGRGSAAGSLVAYSLGITEIDPLKYNLLFERFLNPERKTMPDIDTDIPDIYRDDIINYVTNKYGKKRVSGIVTFGTLAAKQVLRDTSRIFNVPLYKVDRLTSFIPVMSHKKLNEFYKENNN
ncbi:MAG TPA: DNA polymerase III subunit alpha, partial [Candidatus Onthousia faecipullorum]|nr:DNA polymerase III subunit alpha [Candidatus Onthousia faecipullorum]